MRHGLTKEMRAKKRTSLRMTSLATVVVIIIYFGSLLLSSFMAVKLYGSPREADFEGKIIISTLAVCLTVLVAIFVWYSCKMVYALIRGMSLEINDNYVIGFTPTHYQFSRIYEAQDYFAREHTVRLYLTMDSDELEMLYREQWSSVWFEGRAILPIELAIPGRSFSTLYICRSTLKRIRKEVQQSRRRIFVQLVFEFKETGHIGRTSYDRTRLLLSMWDVEKLRAMHQSQPDISFADDSQRYLITWEQLEQYERTLTEAYQIIDPQPITRSDDTV